MNSFRSKRAAGCRQQSGRQENYFYDLNKWLSERGSSPYKPHRRVAPRNDGWHHMYNADIISMPDKWEYWDMEWTMQQQGFD